jgi:hypothetical protein
MASSHKQLFSFDFNGFRLGEGGDFHHRPSCEALNFKFTKNCYTKHLTATFAKPVLAVRSFCLKFSLIPISIYEFSLIF